MCGIYGYINYNKKVKKDSVAVCLEGLKRLEYRGYDSAGIAGIINGKIQSCKKVGKVHFLEKALSTQSLSLDATIAHTRWATHGSLTEENAHPHFDQAKEIALVHNGIIENCYEIKNELAKQGIRFISDTDTEIMAQLIGSQKTSNLVEALKTSIPKLKGSFAIALIHKDYPDKIVAAARDCPLAIGISKKNKEIYLSSDVNAFHDCDLEILYLQDNEIALIEENDVQVCDLKGDPVSKQIYSLGFDPSEVSKNGYSHYMLKEIHEQPLTIKKALEGRTDYTNGTSYFEGLNLSDEHLNNVDHIVILGCGTSWHAGCIAASMFENIAKIPTRAEIASEFRYTNPIISERTLVIAISQSGETADTLAAVKEAKLRGAHILALCNVENSTLFRLASSTIALNAGPEISVCSTKAFTSQLIVLSLVLLHISRLKTLSSEEGRKFLIHLKKLPHLVERVLLQEMQIQNLANKYAEYAHFFYLGRKYMYPASLEAALKLKEISYINACAFPAGEMKHGPIALVNPNLPTIAMCGNKETYDKLISNLREIEARKAPILAFAPEGAPYIEDIATDVLWLPSEISDELATIIYSIAAQLFAYYVALKRGTDIDQPRNLAKSVTVE